MADLRQTTRMRMIEVLANDRLGRKGACTKLTKVRVKCSPEDTVGDLKKLIAAQTGTAPEKVCWSEQRQTNRLDRIKESILNVQGPHYFG